MPDTPIAPPRRLPLAPLLIIAATLGACASAPEPREQLAVARATVGQAANDAQDAPQLLAAARNKLAQAEQAVAKKEFPRARQLADEAAADAELAQASARSVRAQRALDELRLGIQQLRQQINAS